MNTMDPRCLLCQSESIQSLLKLDTGLGKNRGRHQLQYSASLNRTDRGGPRYMDLEVIQLRLYFRETRNSITSEVIGAMAPTAPARTTPKRQEL